MTDGAADYGQYGTRMESTPRLKAEIWVKGLIRRCEVEGVTAMVVRRGDATSGTVLVKVNTLNGEAQVYSPTRDGEGALIWMSAGGAKPEPEADAYIEKQRKFDPDLWVVEIEDRAGRHFLQEPVT
ncbi:DUF1491 family protein [Parvibaculum sp.]|uniref:DUF1491 family protein n=1 Tax=Parvibaculum sp. TaxID=2024848 RepID=UPI0027245B74|nr:DUF1491 family protein [Parvibaculum sp.]MDO9126346.1 DUF1491 family protein [Parvibaculum sp.]MDP1627473.1 DUF1491 family protein [Parvibaculum sp.]MDP2148652.1 DUF1491 family protein [Parvibaculum sp.]MDP3326678.1 DUF1491 family protein [Parvibaculum sp.]